MSWPGVRIVVEIGTPPIRISSGSSPATVSGREVNVAVLEATDRGSDGYAAHRPSMPAGATAVRRQHRRRQPDLAADHPDLQDADGVGALVAVRDEVVVHVERAGPGVVPVDPQRGRAVADGGLQQIVGEPGALVRLPDVDRVQLAFGRARRSSRDGPAMAMPITSPSSSTRKWSATPDSISLRRRVAIRCTSNSSNRSAPHSSSYASRQQARWQAANASASSGSAGRTGSSSGDRAHLMRPPFGAEFDAGQAGDRDDAGPRRCAIGRVCARLVHGADTVSCARRAPRRAADDSGGGRRSSTAV